VGPWHEIEFSAVEEDSGAVVLEGSKATGLGFDGLNTTVETFTHGVGNPVSKVAENVSEVSLKHLGNFDYSYDDFTASWPFVTMKVSMVGKSRGDLFD